jgi:hypothetical protein
MPDVRHGNDDLNGKRKEAKEDAETSEHTYIAHSGREWQDVSIPMQNP